MNEEWRDITGYEGIYQVSNMGRVRNTRTGHILKGRSTGGYLTIRLFKNRMYEDVPVHILVLKAFVGPRPVVHEAHHENKDRTDNRLENLEWILFSKHRRVHSFNPWVPKEVL